MFVKRLISAIVMIALLVGMIFLGGIPFWIFVGAIQIAAFWELNRACGIISLTNRIDIRVAVGMVIAMTMSIAMHYFDFALCALIATTIYLLILLAMFVFKHDIYSSQSVGIIIFAFVYTAVLPSFIGAVRDNFEAGIYLVWIFIIAPVASDTFAYLIGSKFGKHKLAPKVSPKKSIEGSVGGVVGAILCVGLYAYFMTGEVDTSDGFICACLVIGFVCGIISQIGDLAASAIKREHGIKDYSNLIPGHGGVLDRVDSIIFIAPIVYLGAVILDKFFLL